MNCTTTLDTLYTVRTAKLTGPPSGRDGANGDKINGGVSYKHSALYDISRSLSTLHLSLYLLTYSNENTYPSRGREIPSLTRVASPEDRNCMPPLPLLHNCVSTKKILKRKIWVVTKNIKHKMQYRI